MLRKKDIFQVGSELFVSFIIYNSIIYLTLDRYHSVEEKEGDSAYWALHPRYVINYKVSS